MPSSFTPTENATYYAIWKANGAVAVCIDGEFISAIPYVYTNGEWKQAVPNVYINGEWKVSTGI